MIRYMAPMDLKRPSYSLRYLFIVLKFKIIGKKAILDDYFIYLTYPVIAEYLNMRKFLKCIPWLSPKNVSPGGRSDF